MTDPLLRMTRVSKRFGAVTALSDVSIDVVEGEVHALCGENGAGKSTLMKVLSGVYPAGSYDGSIELDGEEVRFRSLSESEDAGVVIIHQELALIPHLSVAENIFLGGEITRRGLIDWRATNDRAAELMARVGLDENPTTPVRELGIGKQQLVEIAKALSKRVRVLILDEPTAALGQSDSDRLLDLIEQLRGQGITCIVISHKLREVLRISDRITVIRDGSVIETMERGDPATDEGRIIRAMVGRDLDSLFPPREPLIGDELLRVENWTVHHPSDPSRVIVDDVSFSVRAGEIVGFAGLMGAGRTELAMSVFGRSYGSGIRGSLFKKGKPIEARSVEEAISHGIAYATEDRKALGLNLIGDIQTNTSSVGLERLSRRGLLDLIRERKIADAYRYKMNVKAPDVTVPVGYLSGGNQQKVVLAKWMFANPDVLILDEPTRGIDVGAKYEIYGFINELAAQGKAIIVISSELPEVIGLSDRIYTLAEGRLTGEVAREDATQERLMRFMTAGL
ncbi:xylose ABC transporter ATP-binding protein [Microbacterium sorbitolivorans]|uniref:Sugar ABC transporter ATP-binding protein n=1 Tax=Microbacterium sorbitolivorans TaxID=1867410 RepID=A0A367Y430_9MICO|nr:sugar ABC transporter ATP-binding protein [Microbacterium sorbitolivorans]RCK59792.1 sugar ABC transporter ATP-binding protein [Microbacterium sorbitolivorans]GGF40033.1 xylose ABC transporter ATP-binding protein [Microbacterium sorbitolivorans]